MIEKIKKELPELPHEKIKRYVNELGIAYNDAFFITDSIERADFFDKCVNIYPIKDWEEFARKIKSLPETSQRRARRYFFAGTVDGVLDAQGRITVTPAYRQFASLEKDVVVIGNDDHIEIWASSVWESEQEFMTSEEVTNDLISCGF